MPSLLDIRRRIRAVRSTQQITKAMKMVAASKLRRSQERIQRARPFARQMQQVLSSLASRVDQDRHPLLDPRDRRRADGKLMLIVITADRGLCGSFNSNVVKQAAAFILHQPDGGVTLGLVGRKGRDFFARRGFEVRFEHVHLFAKLQYEDAQNIAQTAVEEFAEGRVDAVELVYNEFKSVLQQRVVLERLLPIARLRDDEESNAGSAVDYLYEPSAQAIFDTLLPRHVEVQIYRALLESNAAFFAAQMAAMDSATKNAAEMIDNLTLNMNKVRQAAITREIIEVVSGSEAL
jgi:F-type H+-transporting ATPase subunit gamma